MSVADDESDDSSQHTGNGADLGPLGLAIRPISPAPTSKARLLAEAALGGRLSRFAPAVAELLELPLEHAERLLDQVDDPSVWVSDVPPPAVAFWVPGGPGVRDCVRGFVRIPPGESFPDHEHLGEERGLVITGSFSDPTLGEAYGPGDRFSMPQGSRHQPRVHADGVDLLFLVVVQGGYRVGEHLLLPTAERARQDVEPTADSLASFKLRRGRRGMVKSCGSEI